LPRRPLQVAMQLPARRSQGCEVARVLKLLDTGMRAVFPRAKVFFVPPLAAEGPALRCGRSSTQQLNYFQSTKGFCNLSAARSIFLFGRGSDG